MRTQDRSITRTTCIRRNSQRQQPRCSAAGSRGHTASVGWVETQLSGCFTICWVYNPTYACHRPRIGRPLGRQRSRQAGLCRSRRRHKRSRLRRDMGQRRSQSSQSGKRQKSQTRRARRQTSRQRQPRPSLCPHCRPVCGQHPARRGEP